MGGLKSICLWVFRVMMRNTSLYLPSRGESSTKKYPLEGIIGVFLPRTRFKLKASTLLETIIATLLIVLVFLISSLIINNLAKNTFKNNHNHIRTEMKRLGYMAQQEKIALPYYDNLENWEISVVHEDDGKTISISAISVETNKELNTQVYVNH